jgi:thiamine-monophosphate kinase
MSGASDLSITTTVLGTAFAPLMRSGARAGDRVYVTGRLGGVRAGLMSLQRGDASGPHRDRFARPVPRFDGAHWLAARGATAAIDISDGLLVDLSHLAAASGVGVVVRADQVPCSNGVSVEDALQSGEEYELLVTSPSELDVGEFQRRFGIELTEIGRVRAATPGTIEIPGIEVAALTGYDHFSR